MPSSAGEALPSGAGEATPSSVGEALPSGVREALPPGVEEGGEGFGDTGGIVDDDWTVCSKGGDGEGHSHTVVVEGSIFTTFEECAVKYAALKGVALNGQLVAFSRGGHSHFCQSLKNSLTSVALLASKAFETENPAGP